MLYFFYIVFIFFEEVLYKALAATNFYSSIINSFFYYITIAGILAFITNILPKKLSKIFFVVSTFILTFWYGACILVKRTFGITLSFSSTGMADQFLVGGFFKQLIEIVVNNLHIIAIIIIPFIICILITKFYDKKFKVTRAIKNLVISVVSFALFIGSLFVLNTQNGLKELYFEKRNNNQNVEYFGVLPSLFIDIRKELTGFEEQIIIEPVEPEEEQEPVVKYKKQISDIDFKALAAEETDPVIKQLDEYFASEIPTYTSEYSGMFEGKNLIYIMAESFDGYFVSKELTPTLYKMIHSGFYFSNFYSATNLSTIGGEFEELTGLFPDLTCLSWKWRQSQGYVNYYPYALGTLFKDLGYSTYAYHDHSYSFQDRNKYLKTLGFDNYIGCGSGMENKGLGCFVFPESDDEMILGTYKDFINDEHFMVYYATVSGHMGWSFESNKMSIKHKDEVADLNLSDTVKAYVAANLDLELAMTDLLKILEENGRLEDTVIVLAADHHPYGLSQEQMNELAGKELDPTFELYRNNLIIYNSTVEYTKIETPCHTMDVLPTTLNLFGIPYDSRLIIGKDILSGGDGLVMFADGSWLTNKGRYNNNTNKFESNDNSSTRDKYVERINRLVSNRILVSRNIMYYDYYREIFDKQ